LCVRLSSGDKFASILADEPAKWNGEPWQMDSLDRIIQVSWRHRVLFTDHLFSLDNPVLRETLGSGSGGKAHKALIVLDEALAAAIPGLEEDISAYFDANRDAVTLVRPPLLIDGGEQVKNSWSQVSALHEAIHQHHLDRHSYLMAVGGGALLDAAGLAASTAHRGLRHVRVPTTTLSQCDSGVGVKNGINAFGKKNFVGTFAPPFAVLNDFQWLLTLAPRDKRAGYSEAVKVACIRDGKFFESLERDADALSKFNPDSMRRLIHRSAELHVVHIAESGDPFEFGAARPLDFGHWAAHKLEQLSDFRLRHGEAVAIGIALDVVYACRMGYLDPREAKRVLQLLEKLGFELYAPELVRTDGRQQLCMLEGLEEFREHLGGRLTITLLHAIGAGFETHEMNSPTIKDAILELQARQIGSSNTRLAVGA
jgi:3-dehydroquinate synthase